MTDSASVEAITLARAAFSSAQGQLGLIKFSIEELVPAAEADGEDAKVWNMVCSFYESLGSPTPSKYSAVINLTDKTVSIKKVDGGEVERKFTVVEQGEGDGATGSAEEDTSATPPTAESTTDGDAR